MLKFCEILLIFSLSLFVLPTKATAAPCARTAVQEDAWVQRSVDTLVRGARAAYEDESAEKSYVRTLRGIANTIKQCKFTDNAGFIARYPDFFEYIRI